MLPDIRPLVVADLPVARGLIAGYTSSARYEVTSEARAEAVRFELRLVALAEPYVKRYTPLDAATARHYRKLLASGHCLGAFAGEECAGIALCERQDWNASLVIWEFHIAASARRQGIGRRLMAAVIAHAQALGLRGLACETQTTNASAIAFYRAQGFAIAGLDLGLYSNEDRERGEVAVFMRRRLTE